MLYRTEYRKPDGRRLWLYAGMPMQEIEASRIPMPHLEPAANSAHMRWNPFVAEWVIVAAHRQERTFLPPADDNPLAPTTDPARPTELPAGDYTVAVFENAFASLTPHAEAAAELPGIRTAAAFGACEVVVFAKDAKTSLGQLPDAHVALLLAVWADRTRELAARGIRYVLPFENRGVEMGVTLHHPHGQIYGYGFLPARQARVADRLEQHFRDCSRDLLVELAQQEAENGIRLVTARERAIAFVPAFARFPYETWIAPLRPAPDLISLSDAERADVASVLAETLRRLDALWSRPMPYLMTVNQVPTDGRAYRGWTLRIEICPIRRSARSLKYLAGTELAADVFVADVVPERAAAELRGALA